jgi:hypothetical protein
VSKRGLAPPLFISPFYDIITGIVFGGRLCDLAFQCIDRVSKQVYILSGKEAKNESKGSLPNFNSGDRANVTAVRGLCYDI